MMDDVLVVGAGPAGSIAAMVLARAGARVRLIDRAAFPRDKLCGDTVNPGTLALLARLGVAAAVEQRGLPVAGMRITGPHGVAVEARYPPPLCGRAIVRRELDWLLLQQATAAGRRSPSSSGSLGIRSGRGGGPSARTSSRRVAAPRMPERCTSGPAAT